MAQPVALAVAEVSVVPAHEYTVLPVSAVYPALALMLQLVPVGSAAAAVHGKLSPPSKPLGRSGTAQPVDVSATVNRMDSDGKQ